MDCITLLCALTNCPHLPSQDYTGPLGIDYHCLYTLYTPHHPPTYPPTYTPTHTHTTTTHALLAILTLLSVLLYIRLISHTASHFFSPTLQQLGLEAKLSDHFAGVTVLAFGNGSPDIFTLVAARQNLPLGINALLGGVLFVCNVVVGAIALQSGGLDDSGGGGGVRGEGMGDRGGGGEDGGCGSEGIHHGNVDNVDRSGDTGVGSDSPGMWGGMFASICMCMGGGGSSGGGGGGLSVSPGEFLRDITALTTATLCVTLIVLRNTLDFPTAIMFLTFYITFIGVVSHFGGGHEGYTAIPDNPIPDNMIPEYQIPDDSSGGEGKWSSVSYFSSGGGGGGNNGSGDGGRGSGGRGGRSGDVGDGSSGSGRSDGGGSGSSSGSGSGGSLIGRCIRTSTSTCLALTALVDTLLCAVETPVRLLLHITVPIITKQDTHQDSDMQIWARRVPWFPLFVPLLCIYWVGCGGFGPTLRYVLWGACVVLGVGLGAACWLPPPFHTGGVGVGGGGGMSAPTHPTPTHTPYIHTSLLLWLSTAFLSCVLWISLLAAELLPCICTLGLIFHIPPTFMALTIIAWGNSVGDLFTNTALARDGKGVMALAGCYGAPVLNILVGLGLAVLLDAVGREDRVFKGGGGGGAGGGTGWSYDQRSVSLSLLFLFITLLTTASMVVAAGFKVTPRLGGCLLCIYAVYTGLQCLLLAVH